MKWLAAATVVLGVLAMSDDVTAATDVWIDTDPAAGLFERDVDDAVALIQAFRSPEITIHGISVVFGNTSLDKAVPITEEVTERFGPEGLEVYPGAASEKDLGKTNPAVEAMIVALRQRPMTILALGPLTNVASLLQLHPDAADRIDAIVAVAGRRPGQRFTFDPSKSFSFPDANFEHDPEAMQVLLDSGVKIVLTPWEVSSHVFITDEDLERLEVSGGSGAWLAEKAESWIALWHNKLGAPGFNPFDTLAIAWVTHPELLKRFDGRARIVEGGPELGGREPDADAEQKPYLLVEPGNGEGDPVIYTYEPDPAFKDILLDRLTGRDAS